MFRCVAHRSYCAIFNACITTSGDNQDYDPAKYSKGYPLFYSNVYRHKILSNRPQLFVLIRSVPHHTDRLDGINASLPVASTRL